jgi:hypothetical protein
LLGRDWYGLHNLRGVVAPSPLGSEDQIGWSGVVESSRRSGEGATAPFAGAFSR